jgi:Ca2+/Na+ antiporter
MLVWLLVLLLLLILIYVVYRLNLDYHENDSKENSEHHYTFKL